jgi:glycerol-3-phosphate dehydrogenase subunit B
MVAGDASLRSTMLIVGFSQYLDFFPAYIADNLNAQNSLAQDITLDLRPLRKLKLITASILANLFDDPEFRQQVIDDLKPKLGRAGRIGFPSVLGFNRSMEVIDHLESELGLPIFEIPGLPPSIPGIRLHNVMCAAVARNGGVITNGMNVTSPSTNDQRVIAIWSEAASRKVAHPARDYVLATGGYLGGGINVDELGYAKESIFGFPVDSPRANADQFDHQFLSQFGHPIFSTGLNVDPFFRLVNETGHPVFSNLFIAGSLIGSCDSIRERSLEGIALTSGYKIGEGLKSAEDD